MKQKIFCLLFIFAFVFCAYSQTVTVYTAGYIIYEGTAVASYFINTQRQPVDLVTNDHPSLAVSIALRGNDVYVSGFYNTDYERRIASFWRNGIPQIELRNGVAAYAIAVEESGVYAAGIIFDGTYYSAAYWINGFPFPLNLPTGSHLLGNPDERLKPTANPEAIAVNGRDVYVVGFIRDGDREIASFWRNGELNLLSLPAEAGRSVARRIVVSDGNVFITGEFFDGTRNVSCFWVNGVRRNLDHAGITNDSRAMAIAVNGRNVYVAGEFIDGERSVAVLWRNGARQHLDVSGFTENSGAFAITIHEGSVFVSGYYENVRGMQFICFWKDGVFHNIGRLNGFVLSQVITVRH